MSNIVTTLIENAGPPIRKRLLPKSALQACPLWEEDKACSTPQTVAPCVLQMRLVGPPIFAMKAQPPQSIYIEKVTKANYQFSNSLQMFEICHSVW